MPSPVGRKSHVRPYEPAEADGDRGITRREFLFPLAAGAVGIAGYYLLRPGAPLREIAQPMRARGDRPHLRGDTVFGRDGETTVLWRGDRGSSTLFAVNDAGERVLRQLDGRHGIDAIAADLAATFGVPLDEALEAQVARFVAEVGIAGFLAGPYHVRIYEAVETT